jgi:hypothetical protein
MSKIALCSLGMSLTKDAMNPALANSNGDSAEEFLLCAVTFHYIHVVRTNVEAIATEVFFGSGRT